MGLHRKTSSQLQALDNFYTEEKYPTQKALEDYAAALGLTYKQVRGWFVEKRRREKRENGVIVPSCSSLQKKLHSQSGIEVLEVAAARKTHKQDLSNPKANALSHSRCSMAMTRNAEKKKNNCVQELVTADYILKKVFRKDGPLLGLEFDSLPSGAVFHHTGMKTFTPVCQGDQGPTKRRKVSKKHGMGKGLMTVWRVTNPDAGDLPIGFRSADCKASDLPLITSPSLQRPVLGNKKPRKILAMAERLKNKLQINRNKLLDKKKHFIERRVVKSNQDVSQKQSQKETCDLALDRAFSEEKLHQVSILIDDEDLELRELRTGPRQLVCSDHPAAIGMLGCSLCKDVLPKFPPDTVKMKRPICLQPWDSSTEIVKKLFKVFHFLYTYAIVVEICPFTLDEFAQAFYDKDSMLLGKIHMALLMLLLSDIEVEISSGFLPHLNKSCNFLALLHSVENQEYSLDFWKRSVNPLTWIEILRQVLVAAGFGSKQGTLRRGALNKELSLLVNYGLRPGTLKCELFKILSEQGNNGCKISQLAKSMQASELNLASSIEDLESLICTTLSSDITLFEKISSSSYRLRMSCVRKGIGEFQSDTEDSGSVDDELDDGDRWNSDEGDSEYSNLRKSKHASNGQSKNDMLTLYTEIDESHPGEVWLLGLMEGEYSNLSLEEKLNALVALTDLVREGSSIRVKDPIKASADYNSSTQCHGSGAKIKRSSVKKPGSFWNQIGQMHCVKEVHSTYNSCSSPVDSSLLISNFHNPEESGVKEKEEKETGLVDLHPIQSVFLGSDRRYNRYWLFLGPCNGTDPGHRRVYFESSEDGHWEVIDTEEALCALLLVLDDRGKREAALIESLKKRQASLCRTMSRIEINSSGVGSMPHSDQFEVDMVTDDSYSPVSDVDNLGLTETSKETLPSAGAVVIEAGKKGEEQMQKWIRLQAYDSWIWNSFYLNLNVVKYGRRSYLDSLARCESCHDLYWRDERHCRICHTTFELDFDLEEKYTIHRAICREKKDSYEFPNHKILSSQIQTLKAAIYAVESVMPEDALVGAWRKSAHKLWVKRLRRTSTLVELLQVLADFVGAINEDWLFQCNFPAAVIEETISSFASMPHTSSALALWLVKLDTIIAPYLDRIHPLKKQESTTGKHALRR